MTPLGLLGGTFDPIHNGHLDVAAAARQALGLERVLLIPARTPPHRHAPQASAAHRFAMAALAAQDIPGLVVSDLEMESVDPSYTSVTLDRLAASGIDLAATTFITGADAFADIATWRDYPAILDRCRFAVVSRPGFGVGRLGTTLPALAGRLRPVTAAGACGSDILLIDAATAPVSSTAVRERVTAGESIADLVPIAVAGHIGRHGLYSGPSTDA